MCALVPLSKQDSVMSKKMCVTPPFALFYSSLEARRKCRNGRGDSPYIRVYDLRTLGDTKVSAATARAIPMLNLAHYKPSQLQRRAVQSR